jgi:hypothetical protein
LIVDAVNIGEDDAIQGGGCDVSVWARGLYFGTWPSRSSKIVIPNDQISAWLTNSKGTSFLLVLLYNFTRLCLLQSNQNKGILWMWLTLTVYCSLLRISGAIHWYELKKDHLGKGIETIMKWSD